MKILITDPIAREGVELLRAEGFEVDERPGLTLAELTLLIRDYDAIIVRSATQVTAQLMRVAKRLRVIGRAGIGLDNIDVDYARKRNIKVLNIPAAATVSVAELTMALMLACARHVVRGTTGLRAGRWEKGQLMGTELSGKTLGIIGLGRIGMAVARRALSFGMRILYYRRTRQPQLERELGIEYVNLEDLLRRSDVITLHVPLTAETRHLISHKELAMMKDGAILINTARGGVVDEAALYDVLKAGKLGAVGLDVYEVEPAIRNRLFEFDRVIGTPHIGAQTREAQVRVATQIAQKVAEELKKL
jgi:D-3-phosphoglycerate dehydrogenase